MTLCGGKLLSAPPVRTWSRISGKFPLYQNLYSRSPGYQKMNVAQQGFMTVKVVVVLGHRKANLVLLGESWLWITKVGALEIC